MNQQSHLWQCADSCITLLPKHGRVWQVKINDQDAFWQNPNWAGDWNAGGDRLWVSPEIDWNWKKIDRVDFQHYEVQTTMDGPNWQVVSLDDERCCIATQQKIKHQRTANWIHIDQRRTFERIKLDNLAGFDTAVAYQTVNSLQILEGTPGQPVDMWSLLQIPGGGKIYIGLQRPAQMRDYFTPIPDEMHHEQERLLTLQITGKKQYKVGISPDCLSGAMAYVRPSVGGGKLVVYRKFTPQFWRPYCDAPFTDQGTKGDAIQVYNDDGSFGGFGEMEYHTPSIVVGKNEQTLEDRCLTIVGHVPDAHWQDWKHHWLGL